jgi:nucleotide-binding universal stress UspA family protein
MAGNVQKETLRSFIRQADHYHAKGSKAPVLLNYQSKLKMKTILVPTDFSKNAENALSFAILLAKKIQARIVLLNAFQIPVPISEIPYQVLEEEIKDTRHTAIKKLRAESEKIRHAGVQYEYSAQEGEALDSILIYTKNHSFDYIIMGTKGAGKNKTGIFGSTTSRLIAKTDVPVIAIPEKAHFSDNIRKITFATNYTITDVSAIAQLSKLAAAFNAQLNVLHVSDGDILAAEETRLMEEFMKKVTSETAYNNLSFQLMPGDDPAKRLEEYINEHGADMIVMSTHLRNALERIFGNSLTKHIALNTQIPLIVFHHHKEASLKLTP